MIIPQENISTFISKNDGQNSLYKLHVPTNVFFEMVKKEITYEFVGFRVARFDSATNTVVDEKKFNGTRDTSFFKAVDYFEELIEKNSPKEEQQKQDDFDSVGLFVYFKGGQEDPFIKIEDTITEIPYQDIDKVFAPPQTKKYGRLDMTVLDDPKYDVVRSKFALKYDEQKSTEIAETRGLTKEDVWVYEMQPYSNGTPEEEDENGGTPPPDVNDNQLNQNDIEGEEPNQREPKEGEKSEKGEKGEKGEKSEKGESSENSEEGEKSESGEEEDEDLGWDEDKNGEPKEEEGSESEDQNQKSENGNEDTGNPPPSDEDGESIGQGEPSDEQGGKPVDGYNMDLIEALNRKFQTDDILSAYKTLKNFMSALRLKGEQIRELAPLVGLNTTATKGEILREIEQQITPFYQ
jgi:hypothetical protein